MVVCRAPEKVCYLSSVKTHCSLYARAGGPMFQAAALSHIGERFEKYPSEACMMQFTNVAHNSCKAYHARERTPSRIEQAIAAAIALAPSAIHSIRTQ